MTKCLLTLIVCLTTVGVALAQSTVERKTFVYSVKDGTPLQLDTYVDNKVAYPGKRPVMLYVHGGGFATGSRVNALQIQYGNHFVAQGFVAIAINYRLGLKEVPNPDQQTILRAVSLASEDLIDATAFILSKADEWHIDPKKHYYLRRQRRGNRVFEC